MSRGLQIRDSRGEWTALASDGPWSLGGQDDATIMLPGAPRRALAFIGRDGDHYFIQPAAPGDKLLHNGRRLTRSAWLGGGDRLSVGGHRLHCDIADGYLRLEPATEEATDDPPTRANVSVEGAPAEAEATAVRAPDIPPPPTGISPAPEGRARRLPFGLSRRGLKSIIFGASAILVLAAGFVLFATPVDIHIDPRPDHRSLSGFPPPLPIGERYLVLPGRYRVRAELSGYQPLDTKIAVSRGNATFELGLEKLPGRLSVTSLPLPGATVTIDGVAVGLTPLSEAKVAAGPHKLEVILERYLPATEALEMIGMGKAQQVAVALAPGWADIAVNSRPAGATVEIDGRAAGRTPLRLELMAGHHRLTFRRPDFDPANLELEVKAGVGRSLDPVVLIPTVGRIAFATDPPGATVTLDKSYAGVTPLELRLAPGTKHHLRADLPGFQVAERVLQLKPGERRSLRLALKPEYGTVFLRTDPPDAGLTVDGRPRGAAVQRLRLTTVAHVLRISKPGYVSQTTRVMPRAGISAEVDIKLKTLAQAKAERITPRMTTAAGQVLRLIKPGAFNMGASRREPGRRANERLHRVVLSRQYYLSERVVTNREYRRFKKDHSSGNTSGQSLNLDDQPVVSVSWDDAARYLNWLSAKDKLPPAYRQSPDREGGTHMVAVSPPSLGYRLPSEAEWAYAARRAGRAELARYPWGDRYPPTGGAGNYADVSARDIVPMVIDPYNDGFPVTAPVGHFSANPVGLFDMGGNVAEWCQDYYGVYAVAEGAAIIDPLGPDSGVHHVVRGAGWRSSSISRLRLSYRDYSAKPRNDLGFRIARFADSP